MRESSAPCTVLLWIMIVCDLCPMLGRKQTIGRALCVVGVRYEYRVGTTGVVLKNPSDGALVHCLNRASNTTNGRSNAFGRRHKIVKRVCDASGGTVIDLDWHRVGIKSG